jgi:hypothetical protein
MAVTATATYGVWLHAAQLSAGRPVVLQRDEGEEGGAAITEASGAQSHRKRSPVALRVRAAQRC